MGTRFWIISGAAALVLIALLASGDSGTVLGIDNELFAGAAITSLWGALIASSIFTRRNLGGAAVQLAIWAVIIVTLMAGYVFRYDLQDVAARLTGGIVPGSPITASTDGGTEVTLIRSGNGHFEAVAGVNGESVRFLVDTGATGIVLSAQDARTAGIDVDALSFDIVTRTANGEGRAARATLDSLYVGGIERENLPVMVASPGRLGQSLLGQTFLESLKGYERRGDRLFLRD